MTRWLDLQWSKEGTAAFGAAPGRNRDLVDLIDSSRRINDQQRDLRAWFRRHHPEPFWNVQILM